MSLCIQRLFLSLPLLALIATGCRTLNVPPDRRESTIRAALEQQVRAWNAGNLAGFMETYARSEQTRFASGGDITIGWQTVFDRYQKKYGAPATMGTLTFSDIEVTPLGADEALAFGRWHLKREANVASGLFTLIFRKTSEGWRIVHDHTSSAAKE